MQIHVATMNILGTADRWEDRRPLLVQQVAELAPDVIGLQEVDFAAGQDELLAEEAMAPSLVERVAEDRPTFGNSLVIRSGLLGPEAPLARCVELGEGRAAVAVDLAPDGIPFRMVTTHLHWQPAETDVRLAQVAQLLAWIAGLPEVGATVLTGDLNATPEEPACEALRAAGFVSAHAAVHGHEPEWTYPSPATPDEAAVRPPSPIDYIWIAGRARATSARTAVDRPSDTDGTLYPSDHRAVAAILELGG